VEVNHEQHVAAKPKKFSHMNGSEKIVFALKCMASVLTLGFAFPNVLTGDET